MFQYNKFQLHPAWFPRHAGIFVVGGGWFLRVISSQNASLTKRWMRFWPGYAIIMEHPSVSLNSKGIIKHMYSVYLDVSLSSKGIIKHMYSVYLDVSLNSKGIIKHMYSVYLGNSVSQTQGIFI